MRKPLDGLLVVALEQAVAAPYCSSRLADAGARVIKVEREEGDFARHYDHIVHGESAYFVWLNRGKESICLNIKDKSDQAVLQTMLDKADVFIQNLAPGACARAGFGSQRQRERHPTLITVDISGYGESGPYRDMKAYDLLVQCESGLASITGSSAEPGRVGVSICDIACGMYAHTAVLQALIERGITGQGKCIQVSLFDAIADWMTVPLLHHEYGGAAPLRVGLNHPSIAPYGAYTCRDQGQVVLSVQNDREWASFCEHVLKRPDLLDHNIYKSNGLRCAHRSELNSEIDNVFSALSCETVIERLKLGRIAFGVINSIAGLSTHPQLRRMSVESSTGPVSLICAPSQTPGEVTALNAIPAIGEHSQKLRAEFSVTSSR